MKIILGSSSPRRKNILGCIIKDLDIKFPEINEDIAGMENALQYVKRISRDKAEHIANDIPESLETLIITCDTIVALNNNVIGKPLDFKDAADKIKFLSGTTHNVISCITLTVINSTLSDIAPIDPCLNHRLKTVSDTEVTEVTFKELDYREIHHYLSSINYIDKAGAYALQENGDMIIKKVKGSVTNVIGFPLRLFFKLLSDLNIVEAVFLNEFFCQTNRLYVKRQ